jgi:hypothetical protein
MLIVIFLTRKIINTSTKIVFFFVLTKIVTFNKILLNLAKK